MVRDLGGLDDFNTMLLLPNQKQSHQHDRLKVLFTVPMEIISIEI